MARKNPFASIMDNGDAPAERPVARDYTFKGASRSLISSIDEMAAQAGKLLEGERAAAQVRVDRGTLGREGSEPSRNQPFF